MNCSTPSAQTHEVWGGCLRYYIALDYENTFEKKFKKIKFSRCCPMIGKVEVVNWIWGLQ
jgi:hypothetical protein